ncbi:MAG: hypothetical protein LWY06_02410 [Firmicutes bacterium]|nr:hypothetical protein [Bacillota bacterium]
MNQAERKYLFVKIAVIIVLFAVMVNLSTTLSAQRMKFVSINMDRPMVMQIFSEMIGELRTILASYIFITIDMYHHERSETESWAKDKTTLPLHRIVTLLDPHFEQSYDFGAYHLAVNLKQYRQAIAFLQEGLQYNPKSFKLNFTMGDIYYFRKEYGMAEKYYLRAYKNGDSVVDKSNILRRMYWCERYLKNYEQARVYLELMKQLNPGLAAYQRFSKELDDLKTGATTEDKIKAEFKRQSLEHEAKSNSHEAEHEHEHNDSEIEMEHTHGPGCGHKH